MSQRKATPAQIRAAYTLYQAGMSLPQIASQCYERLGYGTGKHCENALRRAFKTYGYQTRSYREANMVRFQVERCACGARLDERTRGCDPCGTRHRRRRDRGREFVPASNRIACAGCGGSLDDCTPGCHSCRSRRWWRSKRGLATVSPLRDADVCAGGATILLEAA